MLRKPIVDQTWLEGIRNVNDVMFSESFEQANMIQEVLEGVRNIVRDQVAEALPNTISPQYPPSYDPPPSNQGGSNFNYPPHQQANAINSMPYNFLNAVGQQQPLFAPQYGT